MCRFIETIRIEGGKVWNLSCHNARMNTTRKRVWGNCPALSLEDILKPEPWQERTRCRVVYGENIEEVVYIPYTIRQVSSLKLEPCDDIAYELKSADRSMLDKLFALRGEKDDILIVKNGRITDTSIANVALWNGTEWHTPSFPLLKGTQRQFLLDRKQIIETDISVENLSSYSRICLFNAMIPFGEITLGCEELDY